MELFQDNKMLLRSKAADRFDDNLNYGLFHNLSNQLQYYFNFSRFGFLAFRKKSITDLHRRQLDSASPQASTPHKDSASLQASTSQQPSTLNPASTLFSTTKVLLDSTSSQPSTSTSAPFLPEAQISTPISEPTSSKDYSSSDAFLGSSSSLKAKSKYFSLYSNN